MLKQLTKEINCLDINDKAELRINEDEHEYIETYSGFQVHFIEKNGKKYFHVSFEKYGNEIALGNFQEPESVLDLILANSLLFD